MVTPDADALRGRRLTVMLVLALIAAVPAGAATADLPALIDGLELTPMKGRAPIPFTLLNLRGDKVSLDDYRGRVVMVYLWATW